MFTHLIWFRMDLRIHDNLALTAACNDKNARVLSLFISTPKQWLMHSMAPRKAAFLLANLNNLRCSLASKGIPFLYIQAEDFNDQRRIIHQICKEKKVTHLFYNYQYEFDEYQRDKMLEQSLNDVICQGFDDSVILPPGSVLNNNKMYKVYSAFKNAWLKRLKEVFPTCLPTPVVRKEGVLSNRWLSNLSFNYPQVNFSTSLFPSSEKEALTRLIIFCKNSAELYEKNRDYPAVDGTSRLSACLASGILSPRQCLHQLLKECPKALDGGPGSGWLNEIIWREFYRHLVVYYPDLCKYKPFLSWSNNIHWKHNDMHIDAWKHGRTGYPIIDAAMRQLHSTGWMHNRLRMITASFLVKDLLVDWRIGENYFISHLIDGDLAANNGGWQWAASTGTDSVPYFRIFNPTVQSKKFDENGEFIRRWIPELNIVPIKEIHSPWRWAKQFYKTLNYPYPIIDHKYARIAALKAYKKAFNTK